MNTHTTTQPASILALSAQLAQHGWTRLAAWRAERRTIGRITRELGAYSDRDLSELGLRRGDIPDVARGRHLQA